MKLSLGRKAVCAIVLVAAVFTAVAAAVSYRVYAGTMDAHYRMLAGNVAQTAASVLDAAEVDDLASSVMEIYRQDPAPQFDSPADQAAYLARYDVLKDERYERLFYTLEQIKRANGVLSLYLSYMDAESMTGVYVLDADNTENGCPTGVWDPIYPENREALNHPEDGFPAYITNTEEYGWLCSAGAAVLDDAGQVVAHVFVDISMDSVMADRQAYLVRLGAVLLVATVLLAAVLIWAVNRVLVRPINSLASAASSYVDDREHTGVSALEQLSLHTGDELEHLWDALKQMEGDINRYIENLTQVTAEKERIGAELGVATQIQASMLPCIFPAFPDRPEFDIFASMTPAKEVGGDFYDFFLVDEDHLALVIADVSGKGVPAALFMVIAKTMLKNRAQSGASPKEVLETVNDQLCENNEAEMFVTVWLGILEVSTGKMICANAGHEYPALRRAGEQYELVRDKHGFVLAGMEHARYREYELTLRPGDALFVYTDGVAEATSGANELFGTDRMLVALNSRQDAQPEELLRTVKEHIDAFVGDAPQFDDITMLGLRYLGPAATKAEGADQ